ncbi:MAG: PPC domain-containing DNA-binding protein [Longimicrobiales bacterium]
MRWQRVEQADASSTYALVLETGDRFEETLLRFARATAAPAASFFGLGALERAELAYFEPRTRRYEPLPVEEQVEVVSLVGNIARLDGEPKVHAHCVLGRRDGSAIAGHLHDASVRPTLELFVTVYMEELRREQDEASGLPLISPA